MFKVKSFIIFLFFFTCWANAQQAYFIDGYHGGCYGHYPVGQTSFIVQQLLRHPEWHINLEIEPETWDVVCKRDFEGYETFKKLLKGQTAGENRIEYVNPTYAQSYFFGTSGESVIRQFLYGMRHLLKHFPETEFKTYSSEEPCFTSCLPTVLKSLGFLYASTKNPNTMWGGYVSAYGNGIVKWLGPDGSSLLTVPRYACEDLQSGSTWQSIAWFNSNDYINKCLLSGIHYPVGMCLQDASWSHGWDKGPWLGQDTTQFYSPTRYVTWREYFEKYALDSDISDWHFTQEDVKVSLMWGSQVLQRLTQNIRLAENRVVKAEKLAALAVTYKGIKWPETQFDEAWHTLLLSQHHDCWIVPYNHLQGGKSWAQMVDDWTAVSCKNSEQISKEALSSLCGGEKQSGNSVVVYNTQAVPRKEVVKVSVPCLDINRKWMAVDNNGRKHETQWTDKGELMLFADVPSVGYNVYRLEKSDIKADTTLQAKYLPDNRFLVESDLYAILLNLDRGGCIESLKLKRKGNHEMVDVDSKYAFNELRGYFVDKKSFQSSTQNPATVRVVEQGPLAITIAIDGMISNHPFKQTLRLVRGEERIDMKVRIDWKNNVCIGEPDVDFSPENPRKAFYDDRYKLLLHFPVSVEQGKISKDAPFDVCESSLDNTFYNRWDSIKHNVIVHWADLSSDKKKYGMTLFSDHTTSYAYGEDFPLSLDIQYAGKGLWGMDYGLDGPTEVSYSILPHMGDWEKSRLWTQSGLLDEPLAAILTDNPALGSHSFLSVEKNAYELSAMYYEGNQMFVRFFNAHGKEGEYNVELEGAGLVVDKVELDGRVIESLPIKEKEGKSVLRLSIPHFGISTLRVMKK